jgi:DNA-binding transcriptional LysR family regulator
MVRSAPTAAQLGYLDAVLDHASWKEAAAALGVTPSALSQGLAELERRLGVELFERSGRGRIPTPSARSAGQRARRILAELAQLERWAAEVREGVTGELRVGMIDTAAVWHFGDALTAFRNQNPGIALRLTVQPSGRLTQLLTDGELDVIVGVIDAHDQRIEARPLVAEPIHVYGPPGTRTDDPARWGPWVSFPAESRTRALVARALRSSGVVFDVVAESSQPAVLREMVQLGMGWTALAAVDAEREPHALRRASPEPVAIRVLSLGRHSERSPAPALRRLMDALVVAADRAP